MEKERFDALSRALGAGATRRGIIALLAGAATLAREADSTVQAKKHHKSKKRPCAKKCASGCCPSTYGKCLQPTQQSPIQCGTGGERCHAAPCGPSNLPPGAACTANASCASGHCGCVGTDCTCRETTCASAVLTTCSGINRCCEGPCSREFPTGPALCRRPGCASPGGSCVSHADCCVGGCDYSLGKICCSGVEMPCTQDDACCSLMCGANGLCGCRGPNELCLLGDRQCCSGTCRNDGTCA